jgi:hypothetical protein
VVEDVVAVEDVDAAIMEEDISNRDIQINMVVSRIMEDMEHPNKDLEDSPWWTIEPPIQTNTTKIGTIAGRMDVISLIGTRVKHAPNQSRVMSIMQRETIHVVAAQRGCTKMSCDG